MSYDVRDDLADLKISFPRDYDPSAPVHIGTVIEDEPECHGYCHDTCCQRDIPCTCRRRTCDDCNPNYDPDEDRP